MVACLEFCSLHLREQFGSLARDADQLHVLLADRKWTGDREFFAREHTLFVQLERVRLHVQVLIDAVQFLLQTVQGVPSDSRLQFYFTPYIIY